MPKTTAIHRGSNAAVFDAAAVKDWTIEATIMSPRESVGHQVPSDGKSAEANLKLSVPRPLRLRMSRKMRGTQDGRFGGFGVSRGPLLVNHRPAPSMVERAAQEAWQTRPSADRREPHRVTAVGCGRARPLKISITRIEILNCTSQPS